MRARNKIPYLLLFFLLGLGTTGYAQKAATATMRVSVKVVRGVQVSKVSDLDFGQIKQQTGAHEIKPTDGSAARFVIEGAPGANVFVKLNDNVVLNSANGASLQMKTVEPVYRLNDTGSVHPFQTRQGGMARLCRKSGKLIVSLGGKLNADHAPSGSYSGTYTAVVEYM